MSASPRALAVLTLLLLVLAAQGADQVQTVQLRRQRQQQQRSPPASLQPTGFVRALEFRHQLRVCNAYPYAAALSIYRGKAEQLTSDAPMPYKSCRDFKAPLTAGDKLEFKVGDASAGTFSVSDLPNNDAVLLLIIHRHDTLSTAVAFESHIFASVDNAQVAVIDTYKGSARGMPKIMDAAMKLGSQPQAKQAGAASKPNVPRSEELRYDSVVAVNPGVYEVVLDDADGQEKARNQLVALKHESYVVLRTGVESQQGPSYPQELVIFPNPDAAVLKGMAPGRVSNFWVALPLSMLMAAVIAA